AGPACWYRSVSCCLNASPPSDTYPLSLHDALPIFVGAEVREDTVSCIRQRCFRVRLYGRGKVVGDLASEADDLWEVRAQTVKQTFHDRLTSRNKQDSVVRQGTLNGLNLRSDARGETNHVTESRLHTGLQAVHN